MPAAFTPALRAGLAFALVISACGGRIGVTPPPSGEPTRTPAGETATPRTTLAPLVEQIVRGRGEQAMRALKAKDFATFATFVHAQRGARFTPYTFIQVDRDVVLQRDVIKQGFANTKKYLWGHTDGKGDPMDWTFEEYFTRHLWDKDYAAAPVTRFDHHPDTRGNKFDNTADVYPRGRVVEYYIPDSGNLLDWSGLRLVFEEHEGSWSIVGVIHDEWTI